MSFWMKRSEMKNLKNDIKILRYSSEWHGKTIAKYTNFPMMKLFIK